MTWWQAALWGLAGGGAASLVSFCGSIMSGGYRWPWQRRLDTVGPRLFVLGSGLVLGAVVAAAAHDQMNGPWPAFIFGIGAPATIRGILSGVEVGPSIQPSTGPPSISGSQASAPPPLSRATEDGEIREDAS